MESLSSIDLTDTSATDCEFTTREAANFLRCSEGFLIKLRGLGDGPIAGAGCADLHRRAE